MRKQEALKLKRNDEVKAKATGLPVVVKEATYSVLDDVVKVEDLITGRRYRHDELTK